jgi:hypothetical protein
LSIQRLSIDLLSFIQLPYSQLVNSDRQESVTAALAAAVAASSAMERTRLDEEKLRVHTKEKKDQSNRTFVFHVLSTDSLNNLQQLVSYFSLSFVLDYDCHRC